jgi:drug/metabolite transporter (DMT)-like permease
MPASRFLPDPRLRGVLLFCLAVVVLVGMGTLAKHLAREYPVPQIIWARYFFHLGLMLVAFPQRIPTFLVSERKGLQVLRGALMLVATLFSFTAYAFLPLATVTAITFTAPLVATALSVILLREHVGPHRWAAVAVGFAGVLLIVRPGAGMFTWPVLLPVGFAVMLALYQITTRMVRAAADPLNSLFYTALVGGVATLPLLLVAWRPPDNALEWLWLVLVGGLGGLGHLLMIQAFRRAPVSLLSPLGYTELIWAALLGFIVFGDVPDTWTWLGAAMVAASGLYVLHRERVVRSQAM